MSKRATVILVLDKSEIIRSGLAELLKKKNKSQIRVELGSGQRDIYHMVHKVNPKVLIASPSILEQNEKELSALRDKYDMHIVALIYSFYQPDNLKGYDGLIYLNDSAEKIQSTVLDIIETSESQGSPCPANTLTKREKEILRLLVNGNTTKQIAQTLHISTHTVNAHRKNIMRKLDIKTVSGLTIYAVLNNVITLKEA